METVSAFLPVDRRHALARRQLLPDRTLGAVLFADISGFTHLTDVVARELGPKRGAEEISTQLDRIYSVMIAPVHDFAGSVISFSGDAITCWFDDRPTGADVQESGAVRATVCALAIQAVIGRLREIRTPAGNTVALGVKVAVAAGLARRFILGAPDEQRFEVIAGNLVDRSAAAEQLLRPGEVAVGPEVVEQLGAALEITTWRTSPEGERFALISAVNREIAPSPWLEIPDINVDVASRWLLPAVYERLRSTEGQYLAELRPVVTLFLRFGGINYERDDDAGQKLYEYISWMQKILSRYGGYLLQLIIGDKGSYCFIVFGALHAHEDDAARAVAAAINLGQLPVDLSFIQDVCVGISHGTLHVGAYGAGNRRTFGVIGNETNVAARLMSAAKAGQILVSSKVGEVAQRDFRFKDLGQLALKGLARPVPVLAVVGRRRQTRAGAALQTMVGRDEEATMLGEKLQALQEGQSNTVLIEGEPGIGKSSLLLSFLQEARRERIKVLTGSGAAIEQATPYFAWRPIFRTMFDVDDGESPETVRRKVLERIPDDRDIRELLPLLDTVLPLHVEDNSLTAQMTGEARANSTRNLLLRLLSNLTAATGGLALAFDDAHWFDSASAALLIQARRVLNPVLFLVVTRPVSPGDAAETAVKSLREDPDAAHVRLQALSREQTVALVCDRLGVSHLPSTVSSFIYNHTEGHPFFSEEIAFALRDAGHIRVENGRCVLANGSSNVLSLDFPITIQGVVTSRIDRLESLQQLTLKVASVLGRLFAVHVLRHIHPFPTVAEQIPMQLSSLEELDIITAEAPPPEWTYSFKHNITQEVIYNLMTFSQRKELHCRAAEWYEARYTDDLSPYYPLLAHHWTKAEDAERAIHYLEKAGEQALRNFANEEAINFLSQALAVDEAAGRISDQSRRALWEIKIGEALVHWTRYTEGQEHLERGLALLKMPAPYSSSSLRNGAITLAAIVRQLAHRVWPRRYLGSANEQKTVLLAASRAYSRLVEVYFHSGETLRSIHAAFHTLNLAELAGPSPELAEAYAPIAAFFSFVNVHWAARAYFTRALDAADKANSIPARLFVLLTKATYETGVANWNEARTSIEELIESGRRIGAQRRFIDGLQLKTILLYSLGQHDTCRAVGERLLIAARRLDDRRFQGYGLFAMAFANFHLGHIATAAEHLEDLRALLQGDGAVTDTQLSMNVDGLWCLIHLQQGNLEGARAAADHASQLASGPFQNSYWTLPGYAGPAEVYLTDWEVDGAKGDGQEKAATAVRSLNRFARTFPIGRPAAKLYEGWMQQLQDKPQQAARLWEQGLRLARTSELDYERGRLHYELARSPAVDDARRAEHQRQARACFEAVASAQGLRATTNDSLASGAGDAPFFITSDARD